MVSYILFMLEKHSKDITERLYFLEGTEKVHHSCESSLKTFTHQVYTNVLQRYGTLVVPVQTEKHSSLLSELPNKSLDPNLQH